MRREGKNEGGMMNGRDGDGGKGRDEKHKNLSKRIKKQSRDNMICPTYCE